MKRFLAITAAALISAGSAFAQAPAPQTARPPTANEAPATPPVGNSAAASAAAASPAASMCATKAVDKNGHKLHGAAKKAFMKKCEVNTLK